MIDDYIAAMGFGFFVNNTPDIKLRPGLSFFESAEAIIDKYIEDGLDLLVVENTQDSFSMEQRIFVAIRRSHVTTNVKSLKHGSANPLTMQDFSVRATAEEYDALEKASRLLGIDYDDFEPQNFFFINAY